MHIKGVEVEQPLEQASEKEQQIEQAQSEIEVEGEAQTQVQANAQANAVAQIIVDPLKVVSTKISQTIGKKIADDPNINKKIDGVADKIIDDGIAANTANADAGRSNSEADAMLADFNKNKDEFLHHGINHKIAPWQSAMLLIMNSIWFVLISIVNFVTFLPISIVLSRIATLKGLLKGIAVTIAAVLLIAILVVIILSILRLTNSLTILTHNVDK